MQSKLESLVAATVGFQPKEKKNAAVTTAVAKARARVKATRQSQGRSSSRKSGGRDNQKENEGAAWLKEIEGKLNAVVHKLDATQPAANVTGGICLLFHI